MTKKKMPVGKRFLPGQSGNPSGRRKLPEELKDIAEFTAEEIKRMFAKYGRMPVELVKEAANDLQIASIEAVIASGIMRAIKDGDYARLSYFLDRTIGKVTEKTEIEMPEPVIIQRANGEEIYLAAEKRDL